MHRPLILALSGVAGCGKSTAAAYLAERHGFARVRFAGPLKAMLRALLAEAGAAPDEVERMIEGDRKEAPCPELAGRTPRHAMQALGTAWGRDLIHPELWTRAWWSAASAALEEGARGIVVEDCRFANEADAVRAQGGRILRIDRPTGTVALDPHPSEGQALPVDGAILNAGSPHDLYAQLDIFIGGARVAAA